MRDLAVFECEAHGSTLVISHGEVMYIDADGTMNWYDEEEKNKSLWLEVAAGRYRTSASWKRVV